MHRLICAFSYVVVFLGPFVSVFGCARSGTQPETPESVLRLAVTTSTLDSGLLDLLIPVFEEQEHARVDVIAVGTGAALKLGESGDVDVVLVHARAAEDAFMAAGHGIRREDVMVNQFEILGPPTDPAVIRALDSAAALQKIGGGQRFVSRGDQSGTHRRELKLWREGGGRREWSGYIESGQGMGATLIMADQMNAYVLSDRGTYLKFKKKINLIPLVASSKNLLNPYGILVVNPDKHPHIDTRLAQAFVDFIIAPKVQQLIQEFKIEGEQLFYPLRLSKQHKQLP